MKLVVVGTGYVGLVTGACLADIGHVVTCVDSDSRKIEALQRLKMPIFEPGLERIVGAAMAARRLAFSDHLSGAVEDAEAVFIAVGTPSRQSDGYTDKNFVFAVSRELAPALPEDAVVVVKSTVPVGTGDEVELIINELRPDRPITVTSNPEFLRAGSAVADFMKPDRIVIGVNGGRAEEIMRRIYEPLRPRPPLLLTKRRSSELIKYGANALLATKIALINEIADLCERAGADVQEVAQGIGLDRRIGPSFLQPGPGFGGSCFRKDALALVRMGEDHDMAMRIAEAVLTSNEFRKRMLLRRVCTALGEPVRGRTVAVWGVTFKADTDDIRESCAIPLVTALLDAGAKVRLYDPEGMPAARAIWRDRVYTAADACSAASGAHVVVIMTEWQEFKRLDLARIRRAMANPVIVDLRNLLDSGLLVKLGFAYHSVGRPAHVGERPASGRGNGHDKRSRFELTGSRHKRKEPTTPIAIS
jgi:UDPglucose 6-dehydrogenase